MKTRTRSIRLPGEIKTFSQGEKESTATIAVPTKTWDNLLEELENFKAKVASLEQEYATYREQSQKEILFLKEKIATLEANVTVQDKKSDQDRSEILFLKEKTASQNANIAALDMAVAGQDKKIVVLETAHDKDMERIALEAAYDRQRVTKLEQKEPQPLQKDRGEILRALIATNGGKMLAKYARLKMHLDKATFSRLLGTLSDKVTRKVHQRDRRQKLLVLNIS